MEVRVGDGENAVVALGFSLQPLIAGLQQKGGPDKDGEFASAQQISARTYRGDKEGGPLPILLTMVRQAPPTISPTAPSAPGQQPLLLPDGGIIKRITINIEVEDQVPFKPSQSPRPQSPQPRDKHVGSAGGDPPVAIKLQPPPNSSLDRVSENNPIKKKEERDRRSKTHIGGMVTLRPDGRWSKEADQPLATDSTEQLDGGEGLQSGKRVRSLSIGEMRWKVATSQQQQTASPESPAHDGRKTEAKIGDREKEKKEEQEKKAEPQPEKESDKEVDKDVKEKEPANVGGESDGGEEGEADAGEALARKHTKARALVKHAIVREESRGDLLLEWCFDERSSVSLSEEERLLLREESRKVIDLSWLEENNNNNSTAAGQQPVPLPPGGSLTRSLSTPIQGSPPPANRRRDGQQINHQSILRPNRQPSPSHTRNKSEDDKAAFAQRPASIKVKRKHCKAGIHCNSADPEHYLRFKHTPNKNKADKSPRGKKADSNDGSTNEGEKNTIKRDKQPSSSSTTSTLSSSSSSVTLPPPFFRKNRGNTGRGGGAGGNPMEEDRYASKD